MLIYLPVSVGVFSPDYDADCQFDLFFKKCSVYSVSAESFN